MSQSLEKSWRLLKPTSVITPYSFSTFSLSSRKQDDKRSCSGLSCSVNFSPWMRIPSVSKGIWKARMQELGSQGIQIWSLDGDGGKRIGTALLNQIVLLRVCELHLLMSFQQRNSQIYTPRKEKRPHSGETLVHKANPAHSWSASFFPLTSSGRKYSP